MDNIILGMSISFEPNKESNTLFEWRGVWMNILNPIKYLDNQVWRFLNFGMGASLSTYPNSNTRLNI